MPHAGAFNTISCAVGHHLAEGRWVRTSAISMNTQLSGFASQRPNSATLSQIIAVRFADAVYERFLVNHDREFLINLLDDLVSIIAHGNASDDSLTVCFGSTMSGMAWKNPSAVRAEKEYQADDQQLHVRERPRYCGCRSTGRAT